KMSRTNPFDDDYQPSKFATGSTVKSYQRSAPAEDEQDYYEREIEKYMQESLDSTERSRRHLENSERTGVQTAQELLEQREKLEKTERNLDTIHTTTQQTQRNLNSLKSVFGGFFKNKFSRKPSEPSAGSASSSVPQSKSAVGLSNTAEMVTATPVRSGGIGPTLSEQSRQTIKGTRWEAMDQQIDDNLDLMTGTLQNLRSLGTALGTEIEDQNKLLDRIQVKADRNDAIVRNQDAQMKKLLGYTPADKAAEKK
ncbi:snap-29, partial [Pristionchus pacificus]